MSRENHMTAHLTTMVPQPVQNLPIIEKIKIHIYGNEYGIIFIGEIISMATNLP